MYEIWEVVRYNDYEWEPLILIKRSDNFLELIDIKKSNQNYIITNKMGEIVF